MAEQNSTTPGTAIPPLRISQPVTALTPADYDQHVKDWHAPDASPVPADYQRTVDVSRHTTEHVHGNRTAFDTETHTDDSAGGTIDNRLLEVIDGRIQRRQEAEDKRANARNRNRLYILVFVLVMEMFLPTLAGMHLLPPIVIKYEVLAITAPDALLTVYAFWRKY
jgi:hypothetical protein